MDGGWRAHHYGRISGREIERCLGVFRQIWSDRQEWLSIGSDEDRWLEVIQKMMPSANWTPYYQLNLFELLARVAVIAGITEVVLEAASSENPTEALLDSIDMLPDEAPDNAEAIPIAFAMIGNLDAISLYSRSINDMISACKDGEIEALFQALTVDSYISTMPFFQAAMRVGQLSGDSSFADQVFRAIKGPHKKRSEYPELRWVEYLLRDQGAFVACSTDEIYDLVVEHLKIYDPTGEKKDAKAALFKLFRTWQIEAGIQKPRFGFSGNRA